MTGPRKMIRAGIGIMLATAVSVVALCAAAGFGVIAAPVAYGLAAVHGVVLAAGFTCWIFGRVPLE